MRNCWNMSRYTIPIMVASMKKKWPYTLSLLRAQNTFTFGLSRRCSKGNTWIFAAPYPAVVGIDLTTGMKRAIITENYGGQKSIIVLYPLKHLLTISVPGKTLCFATLWQFKTLYMPSEYI
jgi:hypothetical protein